MYKVFIDHKPVVFITKSEFSENFQSILYSDVHSLKHLKELLQNCSIDHPLQVICKDDKVYFKKFFKKYVKIKAAGGIVQRKNKFLVIKRKGLWDIPKGKIDKGEDRETACVREIEEECGISGHQIVSPLCVTYHTMKYKRRNAIKKTYWYYLTYEGPKETYPQAKEGITKATFVSEEKMLGIRGNTYGSINEVLDAYCALIQTKEAKVKE